MSTEKSTLHSALKAASARVALYDYAAAIELIEPALAGADTSDAEILRSAQELLANALYVSGHQDQAVAVYDSLLTLAAQHTPSDERSVLAYRLGRALCLRASGQEKSVSAELDGILADRSALLGASNRDTLNTRHHRMVSMRLSGEHEAAEQEGAALVEEQRRTLGEHHEDVYAASIEIGRAMLDAEKFQTAEKWFSELYASASEHLGNHPYRWSAGREWARSLAAVGQRMHAVEQAREALAGAERLLGPEHPSVRSHKANLEGLLSSGN